jgi:hypothetical protein
MITEIASFNALRSGGLLQYTFTALTLNSLVDIETVAEVFVRINGQGKKLNQPAQR